MSRKYIRFAISGEDEDAFYRAKEEVEKSIRVKITDSQFVAMLFRKAIREICGE